MCVWLPRKESQSQITFFDQLERPVDCPTRLTVVIWICQTRMTNMTNTSEKYERKQQGNLLLERSVEADRNIRKILENLQKKIERFADWQFSLQMVSASCTYKERKQLSEVQSSQYARVGLRIKALSRLEVVKLTKKYIKEMIKKTIEEKFALG